MACIGYDFDRDELFVHDFLEKIAVIAEHTGKDVSLLTHYATTLLRHGLIFNINNFEVREVSDFVSCTPDSDDATLHRFAGNKNEVFEALVFFTRVCKRNVMISTYEEQSLFGSDDFDDTEHG